jgi:hypothetical protein
MAVAVDAAGTGKTGVAATSLTEAASSITVGAGANRALALLIQFGAVVSNVAAFWDEAGTNQAMKQIGNKAESDNLASAYIFGLIAPTSGAKLLKVTWTTSASWTYGLISFTGADQADVLGTFRNFISGNPSSAATSVAEAYPTGGVNVNSPANDFCLLSMASNNQAPSTTTGQTGQVGTFFYGLGTNVSGAAVYTAGAGASTNLSISVAGNGAVAQPCCWAACDIAAVGAATRFIFAGYGIEDRSADIVRQINKTIMVPYY